MKICSIIGTRPQIIKYSAMIKHLRQHNDLLIHTGQHYDYEMSQAIMEDLNVQQPQYNLEVNRKSHGNQTGEALQKIENVLKSECPDIVLVYGDCNTTLAGAIAAVKLHIPVGHIEAGLRTFDFRLPEEINRRLTDHCSKWCFAPTNNALLQLKQEGIGGYLVGDVTYDAFKTNIEKAKQSTVLATHGLKPNDYYLATVHRSANTDNPRRLHSILRGISNTDKTVVLPVHPRTRKQIETHLLRRYIDRNVLIIKPVGYLDMLCLEMNATKIITDSGGVQKEAYFLQKPCVVLRNKHEYPNLIDERWNILVGTNMKMISNAILSFDIPNRWLADFGNGGASKKIIEILEKTI